MKELGLVGLVPGEGSAPSGLPFVTGPVQTIYRCDGGAVGGRCSSLSVLSELFGDNTVLLNSSLTEVKLPLGRFTARMKNQLL